ncbi:MAG: aldehyde ferredoxin oxidoreductase, partial [Gemmatimonadetes bacterium]|nr:aldehyde ferredoxin oxidoreductase [Gemmatimonadota bacterium]
SGFLGGTNAMMMGRWMAVGRSPLTLGWGEANCGGTFAAGIRAAGVDGIFFSGRSERPVCLKISDQAAELADAAHLWGLDAVEAEKRLIAELGGRARVALIGPAGERLSLISGIVNDGGRIAARSGLGAVMGSKNLKAVAIAGRPKVAVADPDRVQALNQEFNAWFRAGQKTQKKLLKPWLMRLVGRMMRVSPWTIPLTGDGAKITQKNYGTIITNVLSAESGDSPVMNWKGSGHRDFPIATHAIALDPQGIIDREVKKYHCWMCPVGCGGIVQVKDGEHPIEEMHKPEYETCCAFGTLLLNRDMGTIYAVNDLLNRAGMDTISAGSTVAFAIECVEQGILSRDEVDGLELTWGNSDAILALVRKMIAREGVGDLLADGVRRAAARIGRGSEAFAMHAGGQELPMHDSRFDPGFAVSYALEPTPGRHTNHGYQWLDLFAMNRIVPGAPKPPGMMRTATKYDPEGKWKGQVLAAFYMQLYNACGGCLFGAQFGGRLPIFEYLNAVTGWSHDPAHYLRIGERIQNLRQAFNFKHGLVPGHDFRLPPRALGEPPLDSGPMKGLTLPHGRLFEDYLKGLGWDPETGRPTRAKLEELGLQDVAREIGAS